MAYFPKQGDIIRMDFNPTKGHEQQGLRPAVVVSNSSFNHFARGVVMTDQVKALDLAVRNAEYIERIPSDILIEVCDVVSGYSDIE